MIAEDAEVSLRARGRLLRRKDFAKDAKKAESTNDTKEHRGRMGTVALSSRVSPSVIYTSGSLDGLPVILESRG